MEQFEFSGHTGEANRGLEEVLVDVVLRRERTYGSGFWEKRMEVAIAMKIYFTR